MRLFLPVVFAVMLQAAHGAGPLVQSNDFEFLGAFRLPESLNSEDTFEYGGTALGLNPAGPSLFLCGHDWYQRVAEVSIPQPGLSTNIDELPRASFIQPFVDIEAQCQTHEGNKIGGTAVYSNKLLFSVYIYYDAPGTGIFGHGYSDLNLTNVHGLYRPLGIGAGFVNGYMCPIPGQDQAAFGGPMFTGNGALSIVSRTSYGPSVSVFDPNNLGAALTYPVVPVLAYPREHPLGEYGTTNPYFNGSTSIRGVVFPDGTGSVLFFGSHGLGPDCYGAGTDDPSLHGQPVPGEPGVVYCYDPCNGSKGGHGYPYKLQIWAYAATDLLEVKSGAKMMWEPRPYGVWNPEVPFVDSCVRIGGAVFDRATRRIYVSLMNADGPAPLILTYQLKTPSGGGGTAATTTGGGAGSSTAGSGGGGMATGANSSTGSGSTGGGGVCCGANGTGGVTVDVLDWEIELTRPKAARVRINPKTGIRAVWKVDRAGLAKGSRLGLGQWRLLPSPSENGESWSDPSKTGKANRKGAFKFSAKGVGVGAGPGTSNVTAFYLEGRASTNFSRATTVTNRVELPGSPTGPR